MVFSYSAVFACHFSTLAINKGWPHSHLEQAFPSDYRSGILGSFIRRSLFISASLSDVKFLLNLLVVCVAFYVFSFVWVKLI